MKHELVLASLNPHKVREIKSLLKSLSIQIRDLSDYPLHPPLKEEGNTFLENARQKAWIIGRFCQQLVLADDSGLEVDALDGAPGVFSARFANLDSGECDDAANNAKLLNILREVADDRRGARYRCVLVLVDPHREKEWDFEGTCEGKIARKLKGSKGFGYDPLFYLPKRNCTMAQISMEEKNQFSHRANALKKLGHALPQILKETQEKS